MNRILSRLAIFIKNHSLLVIIFSLALIVPAIFGALQYEMRTEYDTFVSTDSEVYQNFERFNQDFSSEVIIILMSKSDSNQQPQPNIATMTSMSGNNLDQLLQPDNISTMESLEIQMNGYDEVVTAVGPAFLIKQAVAQQSGVPVLPDNIVMIQAIVLDDSGHVRCEFEQVFPDNEHALIAVTIDGGLSTDEKKALIEDIQDDIAKADLDGIDTIVTGIPVIHTSMVGSLSTDLRNMLLLSIGMMFLILLLTFSVRGFFVWRWLPLGVVLIGIIYTFGAMGILSIPITMFSMAVFPILVGLGVDYSIEFHNRYDEEDRRGETTPIVASVTHIGKTIGIALITSILGFTAMFFSPVPAIHDFALTLIIGVVASYLLSVFLYLAILDRRRRRTGVKSKNSKNIKPKKSGMNVIDKGLGRLAPWVIKHPVIILPVAIALCVGGIIADPHIKTQTDSMQYLSDDLQPIQDLHTAEEVLGGVNHANLFIEAEDITNPDILNWMADLQQYIDEEQSDIVVCSQSVTDLVMQAAMQIQSTDVLKIPQDSEMTKYILGEMPVLSTRNLITDDYTAANIVLTLKNQTVDDVKPLRAQLAGYVTDPPEGLAEPPDGLEATVTGQAVFIIELYDALTTGRMQMTLIGIALVFAALFLFFRFNIYRALLAIIPLVLIVGWLSGMTYLLGVEFTVISATLGALIIGLGADYTVLLIMRYYEERRKGEEVEAAITTAITRIGRSVIASGFTTIGGFSALLIAFDFPVIQSFGIVTTITVFFAMVSTLFVLPALIVLIDRWRERRKLQEVAEPVS